MNYGLWVYVDGDFCDVALSDPKGRIADKKSNFTQCGGIQVKRSQIQRSPKTKIIKQAWTNSDFENDDKGNHQPQRKVMSKNCCLENFEKWPLI